MSAEKILVPAAKLTETYAVPRIINGTWQLSEGHSQRPLADSFDLFEKLMDAGLTTFDSADIYTGVEALLGQCLCAARGRPGRGSVPIHIHTKCVPDLQSLPTLTTEDIASIVQRSRIRLGVAQLDLVQLHWWDFRIPGVVEAGLALNRLRQQGLIRNIGVTNFDAPHLQILLDAGVPIVSNQVQFSLLDRRPEHAMLPLCERHGVSLLCYGTVAGGFLSDRYLDQPDPLIPLENRSLVKYRLIIEEFGGWSAVQRLLRVLRLIADKHHVSIATVATRYILQKPSVAAAIVGVRRSDHIADTVRVFSFALDEEDLARIESVSKEAGLKGPIYELERAPGGRHASIMHTNLCQGEADRDEGRA